MEFQINFIEILFFLMFFKLLIMVLNKIVSSKFEHESFLIISWRDSKNCYLKNFIQNGMFEPHQLAVNNETYFLGVLGFKSPRQQIFTWYLIHIHWSIGQGCSACGCKKRVQECGEIKWFVNTVRNFFFSFFFSSPIPCPAPCCHGYRAFPGPQHV